MKRNLRLDGDGQPYAGINLDQNVCKSIDELYGLCQGILCDRVLVEEEIRYLADWLSRCHKFLDEYPANIIAPKVRAILVDNKVTKAEVEELQIFLAKVIGGVPSDFNQEVMATRLPCDEDLMAPIKFSGHSFCFTGKFQYGERKSCEAATQTAGGRIETVTRRLDYLVIGTLASRDWVHSSHGRKIEQAMRNNADGGQTIVVSEENWATWLSKVAA